MNLNFSTGERKERRKSRYSLARRVPAGGFRMSRGATEAPESELGSRLGRSRVRGCEPLFCTFAQK